MDSGKHQSLRLGSKTRSLYTQSLDERLGKIPPQALDLEEAVLGALMLEKDALTNVIDILKPDTFYKDSHKEIYRAIVDLFNNSEPVDILTVTNYLRKNGQLEAVGGAYYITELTSKINSAGLPSLTTGSVPLKRMLTSAVSSFSIVPLWVVASS